MEELDTLLHSQLRLAVMSLLITKNEAEFTYLKEKTDATAGNLSVQLTKLEQAGYLVIKKDFVGKKTRTTCYITNKGREAFEKYVEVLKDYLHLQ